MPRKSTLDLERKLLSKKDEHIEEFHSRQSAWDCLKKDERKKVDSFARKYLKSLANKHIRDRVDFIETTLIEKGYRSIEDLLGDIESTMNADEQENLSAMRPGEKCYSKFQDTLIIAIQFGRLPITKGLNIGAAHIDSPSIVGRIRPLKQNYNIGYALGNIRGGVEPKDFFNQQMAMHFYGPAKYTGTDRKYKNKDVMIRFSIGDAANEPKIIFSEGSYHLNEGIQPEIEQLMALLGTIPHSDKSYDNKKRILLNIMKGFNEIIHKKINKDLTLNEECLEDAELYFLPVQKPTFSGIDKSTIAGYGQDNWANAASLLYGFTRATKPAYTKIAIFYDKEEIGDVGRGSLSTNYFSEMIAPGLAYAVKKELGHHYRMLRKGWSMFADVLEPVHQYEPSLHDMRDSAYLGTGISILPWSGDVGNYKGYESSPEMKRAIRNLFKENGIPCHPAIMGTQDNPTPGASDSLHQGMFTDGIDIGIPCIADHRVNEITSTVDLYFLEKAFHAFFTVEDHDEYIPPVFRKNGRH